VSYYRFPLGVSSVTSEGEPSEKAFHYRSQIKANNCGSRATCRPDHSNLVREQGEERRSRYGTGISFLGSDRAERIPFFIKGLQKYME
jgi:hypothetical protein